MDYTKAKIDDVIKRINELYKKSKEEGLTEKEKEEQQILRRRYIGFFCYSLQGCLLLESPSLCKSPPFFQEAQFKSYLLP